MKIPGSTEFSRDVIPVNLRELELIVLSSKGLSHLKADSQMEKLVAYLWSHASTYLVMMRQLVPEAVSHFFCIFCH